MNRSMLPAAPSPGGVPLRAVVTPRSPEIAHGAVSGVATGAAPEFVDESIRALEQQFVLKLEEIKGIMLVFDERLAQVEQKAQMTQLSSQEVSAWMKSSSLSSLTQRDLQQGLDRMRQEFNVQIESKFEALRHSLVAVGLAVPNASGGSELGRLAIGQQVPVVQPNLKQNDDLLTRTGGQKPDDIQATLALMSGRIDGIATELEDARKERQDAKIEREAATEERRKMAEKEQADIQREKERLEQVTKQVEKNKKHIEGHMHASFPITKVTEVYAFEGSVWDVCIFIFSGHFGRVGAAWVAILLLLTSAMQLFLIFIIRDEMTGWKIDDDTVDAMWAWRTIYGHTLEYMNPLSYEPIAYSLCKGDVAFSMFPEAQRVLDAADEYAPRSRDNDNEHVLPYTSRVGSLMCLCATAIWLMNVGNEYRQIYSQAAALSKLPAEDKTRISYSEDGSQLVVKSLYSVRKRSLLLYILYRVGVASLLAVYGMWYICVTIDLESLLLNCTALQIVLELDELWYQAFCPSHAKRFMEKLAPIERPPSYNFAGLNGRPILWAFSVCAALLVCSWRMLDPLNKNIVAARERLCGGNDNFLMARDNFGAAWALGAAPQTAKYESTYYYTAMQQLINVPSAATKSLAVDGFSQYATGALGGTRSLAVVSTLSYSQAAGYWNPQCIDLIPNSGTTLVARTEIMKSILADAVFPRPSFQDCSSVPKTLCNEDSLPGIRVRQMCPQTCGCNVAASSPVSSNVRLGCPSNCSGCISGRLLC